MLFLSIDIGFKNPGITILDFDAIFVIINNIVILKNINFYDYEEIKNSLKRILKLYKIDHVIIEKQCSTKNLMLSKYLIGYFSALNIPVNIKNPISTLNKNLKNRKERKQFSIDLFKKQIFENNLTDKLDNSMNQELNKSDNTDSINICLKYIYDRYLKTDIKFINIKFKISNLIITNLN